MGLVGLVAICLCGGPAFAQETVDVVVPISVTYLVTNVGTSTSGTSSSTVSFSNASLTSGKKLRISVKANATDFTMPSGTAIPATRVSWTTSNASNGTGSSGSLDSSTYTLVFESNASPTGGSVDLNWSLSAPGSAIHAGNHTLALRWKFESVP